MNLKKLFALLLSAAIILTWCSRAHALTYSWGRQPQSERLTFRFQSELPPNIKVVRSGYEQLSIALPQNFWQQESQPFPVDLSFSRFVKNVQVKPEGLAINLRMRAIGFIYLRLKAEKQLLIDIFYDPVGDKWEPPQEQNSTQKNSQAVAATPPQPPKNKQVEKKQEIPQVDKAEALAPTNSTQKIKKRVVAQTQQEQPAQNSSSSTRRIIRRKISPATSQNNTKSTAISTKPSKLQKQNSAGSPVTPPSSPTNSSSDLAANQTTSKVNPLPAATPYKLRAPIENVGPENALFIESTLNRPPQRKPQEAEQQNSGSNIKDQTNNTQDSIPLEQDAAPEIEPLEEQAEQEVVEEEGMNLVKAVKGVPMSGNGSMPDFETTLFTAMTSMANGEFDAALQALKGMLEHKLLPENMREEVLYTYADALFQTNEENIPEHFYEIMQAYQEAINYNTKSENIPKALLQMGYVNLRMGNIPEAKGYFNLLKKKYPNDTNIPITYYYWGDYYSRQGNHKKAADYFQHVVQNYPDNKIARYSSLGLAKSLNELGYYKQSFDIIDYIEKRWPRMYIDDPGFLMLSGLVSLENKDYQRAKKRFWLYYNLLPEGHSADIALARLGDIYLHEKDKQAAKSLYEKAAEKFPDQEGGLIAQMRLAEEGIFDEPSIKQMFSVFDRPYNQRPEKLYLRIVENYPQSPLAPVAQLKLAMWLLWEDNIKQSLQEADAFLQKFPTSKLRPRALKVANTAFTKMIQEYTKQERYIDIATTWEKYDFLRKQEKFSPEIKIALATALWKSGRIKEALKMAQPFLGGDVAFGPASSMALNLALSIYIDSQNWEKIAELYPKVKNWQLNPEHRRQFEYAAALAYENLGQSDKSIPLWRKLATDIELKGSQRAYALYFLAQNAFANDDLQNVYIFAQEGLSLFLAAKPVDKNKVKDCLDLLIRSTESSGREQEALSWALEYAKYVQPGDLDWPSFTYKLANLYKANKDMDEWRKNLQAIIDKAPDSIYSQMATSDLEGDELSKELERFS